MKKILLILIISLQNLSCKTEENCVDSFFFKRTYDAPTPDKISFKSKLTKEYRDKISDDIFCHINFYINDKKIFVTHDVFIYNEKDSCRFVIKTTNFMKENFKEEDFYKLIDSSKSLKVELVYDDTGETFTFTKCR
ncbi:MULTISPECIES: hypothetical protein [Flavobacterium]|uniref:Uncharacterized protein n=1 Tax=Flavobacterium jumunjinense TaxID=998845 RepID=A0ABV5GIU2_9FLAO|nr:MULTISPECIES: hypothetical protein [Flavobacterium]